jgi:hypothetical protein
MQVVYREEMSPSHSIEIGWSTWNPQEVSIRNRYDSPEGHFSNTASSEIPIADLPDILRVALQRLPEVLGSRIETGAARGR